MTEEEVICFYNQRGTKEKVFDQMDNDFGWDYLPKGLLCENTVFMILTAIIRNFYELLLRNRKLRAFGIMATTRMKAFINRVIAVVAKWTKGGRKSVKPVLDVRKGYKAPEIDRIEEKTAKYQLVADFRYIENYKYPYVHPVS